MGKNKSYLAGSLEISLAEVERGYVVLLLRQIDGHDHESAVKTARIIDALDLEAFDGFKPETKDITNVYSLNGYEVRFLQEQLDQRFKGKKVPTDWVKAALKFEETLNQALEKAERADDEQTGQ